jgi:hypothetical protein
VFWVPRIHSMNGFRLLFDFYNTPGKINCQYDFIDFSFAYGIGILGDSQRVFVSSKNPRVLVLHLITNQSKTGLMHDYFQNFTFL